MVLADFKRKPKNLAMAWVDYKKAYDMVPHSWIIESLKMAQVAGNVITFLQKSMVNWKTELTSCGETLGLVDIKRGIFQGDSQGMELGIKKCGVVVLKRGRLCKSEGIKLINGQTIKDVDDEGYKYLGILELHKFKEREMKDTFRTECLRRFKLAVKSHFNDKNKIKAANTWAVSLIRYGAGTIKWNKEELQEIERKSRKIMTMNKELHPRSDVARIYVPRNGKRPGQL